MPMERLGVAEGAANTMLACHTIPGEEHTAPAGFRLAYSRSGLTPRLARLASLLELQALWDRGDWEPCASPCKQTLPHSTSPLSTCRTSGHPSINNLMSYIRRTIHLTFANSLG
jgi:hypothetical protein